MALSDTYDLEGIRNRTAESVHERVEALLAADPSVCRCPTCVLDLVAFTLNRVTPRYSTSILGDLHPDPAVRKKLQVEIELALQAGLKRLASHPHHL
jgi:hypothetical protein